MNGLALSHSFYQACRPLLMAEIPDIMRRTASGLVGEGSECLGCDDVISQDHDFGAAFCLWLPAEDLENCGQRLERALEKLPQEYKGFPSRLQPQRRRGRVGPMSIEDFYAFFTKLRTPELTWRDWLRIPEHHLASCTCGEVFEDGLGEFSQWRKKLQAFYPRDVLIKKLSVRCMRMAQAGQYNLPRVLKRGDATAAMFAMARFAEAALSFVFLCNRRYTPFYKWAGSIVSSLPELGQAASSTISALALSPPRTACDAENSIEPFCAKVADWLQAHGLSDLSDAWLWNQGLRLLQQVESQDIRRIDTLQDLDE